MTDLSIIIATYNRRRTLERILQALEGQSLPGGQFEVLVVDDGSTDGTQAMVKAYNGPLNMHTFSTGLPAGEYGYQKALNIGIRHACSRYLVFLDSDMVPHRDALKNLLAAHESWEQRGEKVLVRAWWAGRKNPLRLYLKRSHLLNYTPDPAKRYEKKFAELYSRWENLDPNDAVSAFISVRKELAVAVNGFAEQARCWGMDGEFQRRLSSMANVRVVFEPSVYAIHGPVRGDVSQKEYRWTRSLLDHYMKMDRNGLS
jgi:glycosyltransferase involved in cell wall biosynthesis